jgi:hypothetical protein
LPFVQKPAGKLLVSSVKGIGLIQNTESPLDAVIVVRSLPSGSCRIVEFVAEQETYALTELVAG